MKITLYLRTYPVKDAPVSLSLVPCPSHQKHTFTFEGKVYEAQRRELQVIVPDGAVIDTDRNLLSWTGDKGSVKSTANEVFDFARAHASGFRTVRETPRPRRDQGLATLRLRRG
jgi:hypothetical protein